MELFVSSSSFETHFANNTWWSRGATPNVRRTGRMVLELDNIIPSSSPCGPDCTYVTQFDGPYLRCTDIVFNQTSTNEPIDVCGHNAFSATNVSTLASPGSYNIGVAFNMSASRSIKLIPQSNSTIFFDNLQEIESISCIPSWASYVVNVTYSGGLQTITRSEKYMGSIRDMMIPVTQYIPATPECDQLWTNYTKDIAAYEACIKYTSAVWSQPLLQTLTAFNHFSLIDALVSPLSGNYTMLPSGAFTGGASGDYTCGESPALNPFEVQPVTDLLIKLGQGRQVGLSSPIHVSIPKETILREVQLMVRVLPFPRTS